MSIGPLSDETAEKYQEAREVLHTVLDESVEVVEPDVTHLEVVKHAGTRIRELTDGCAFPASININEEASHASPGCGNDTAFDEDMIYLDVGVHVGGYTADLAVTIDLSDSDELAEFAEEALDATLDMVEADAYTGEIGAEIEDVIRGYSRTPVPNLPGHSAEQWNVHTDPAIPNRGAERGAELEVGNAVATEPFAIDNMSKVTEGSKDEIYSLVSDRSVRGCVSRKLLDEVRKEYKLLLFAACWPEGGRSEMAIHRLEQQGILRSYPALKKEDGAMVGQVEGTITVIGDGYENLTR